MRIGNYRIQFKLDVHIETTVDVFLDCDFDTLLAPPLKTNGRGSAARDHKWAYGNTDWKNAVDYNSIRPKQAGGQTNPRTPHHFDSIDGWAGEPWYAVTQ